MTGPYRPIDAIAPEAPAASILTAARQIPVGLEEWRSGVSWLPNGCSRAYGWQSCVDPPPLLPLEKCEPEYPAVEQFDPFMVYVPEGCLVSPGHGIDYNARARASLDAYTAGVVSKELATGMYAPGNPSLENTAQVVATVGAVDAETALSLLLRARSNDGWYGSHTIHVPLWLIPSFESEYLLDNGRNTMGMVRVSPGPGYPGRNPVAFGPVADPAVGEGWIYVTGPVEYALGPIETPMELADQNKLVNRAYHIAERPAILRFDTCGVFAVLARIGD